MPGGKKKPSKESASGKKISTEDVEKAKQTKQRIPDSARLLAMVVGMLADPSLIPMMELLNLFGPDFAHPLQVTCFQLFLIWKVFLSSILWFARSH